MATRADIEAAKKDVQQAQETIAESRENIAETEGLVSEELAKLKPTKRVPYTPRKTRAAKLQYRRSLFSTQREVEAAKKQIAEQEAEISKYQTEVLQPAEAELKRIEEHNAAIKREQALWDRAQELVFKGKGYAARGDPELWPKVKQIHAYQNAAKQDFAYKVSEFQQANPTEKLLVDWDKMKITGIESGKFQQSMTLDDYNKRIEELNKQVSDYKEFEKDGQFELQRVTPKLTQQEVVSTGGGVFMTPQELEQRGIKTVVSNADGIPSIQQRMVEEAEALMGKEKGSTGTAFLQTKELNLNRYIAPKEYDMQGRELYGTQGTASGLINLGPTKKTGESLPTWYKRNIIDTKSTESALDAALLLTGAKAVPAAVRGSKTAIKSIVRSGSGVLSGPISRASTAVVDTIVPPKPKGETGWISSQIARTGLIIGSFSIPGVGAAYGTELTKETIKSPKSTLSGIYKYSKDYPIEFYGTAGYGFRRGIKSASDYLTGSRKTSIITTEGFPRIPRDVTTEYLRRSKLVKGVGGELVSPLKVELLTGSPVREPFGRKILLEESRVLLKGKYYKINSKAGVDSITYKGKKLPVVEAIKKGGKVLTTGGEKVAYGTPKIGERTFIGGEIFAESVSRNPVYWKNWLNTALKQGFRKTFNKYGLPKPKYSNFMINEGDYLPRKAGESANAYYKRAQKYADESGRVAVADAPKTVAKTNQPEFEVVYLYPKDAAGNTIFSRVKIGTDAFGRTIYREFPKRISLVERIGTKLKEKKINYKSYFEGIKKVSEDLYDLMKTKYGDIYVDRVKWFEGKWDKSDKRHFSNVERNLRNLNEKYRLGYSDNLINAFSRIHDILKLRGINITDERIVASAIKEGYLNKIDAIKKLTPQELKLLEEAVRYHHVANPSVRWNTQLSDFTKAAINADRLDITRYGEQVDLSRLFDIKKSYIGKEKPELFIYRINMEKFNKLSDSDIKKLRSEEYYLDYEYGEYKVSKKSKKAFSYKEYYTEKYTPQSYVIPTYKPKTVTTKYRVPKYNPQKYLTPTYKTPKRAYKEPSYKKPTYRPPKYRPPTYYLTNYRTPGVPYRKPPTTKIPAGTIPNLGIIREKPVKKTFKEKKIKKKKKYQTLPTLSQQIIGYRGKAPIRRPKGFEAIRII